MKKKLFIVCILCAQMLNVQWASAMSMYSALLNSEMKIVSQEPVKADHPMVRAFRGTENYREFNFSMYGQLDFDKTILYQFSNEKFRAISVPVKTGDNNATRYMISGVDLQTQNQKTWVVEIVSEPTDDGGNRNDDEPAKFSGQIQILDHTGELLAGRSFENGIVTGNYGDYINPCQGAAITMLTGTIIGGMVGGPLGALGGYLNGMVNVIMNCCCE